MPNMNISCIAFDPNNPQVMYLGTGEVQTEDLSGLGIFKSTDGGKTFQQLLNDNPSYTDDYRNGFIYIGRTRF